MSASLRLRAGLRGGASLRFGPIDSRKQSCAEGSPRSGGGCAVTALPGSHRPLPLPPPPARLRVKPRPREGSPVGGTAGRVAGKVQGWCHTVHRVPSALFSRVISPGSSHKDPLNRPLHGHPGVVGRFRRVVVPRRCTQHHLRRVMVETPPRAGPSPPHGPARFFMPASGPLPVRCPALRRTPSSGPPDTPPRHPPPAALPGRAPRPTAVPARVAQTVMVATYGRDRRAAVTAQTACCRSTADQRAPDRTLGTPAPAGVRFAPGDRHTGRDRPRPRPGRLPRDAAGCRACPIRTEGLTIT